MSGLVSEIDLFSYLYFPFRFFSSFLAVLSSLLGPVEKYVQDLV